MAKGYEDSRRAGCGSKSMLSSALRSTVAAAALLAASQSGAADAASDAQSVGLEEIVVTAQNTKEDLQKVPISITELSQDTLRERGVSSAPDLQG